MRVLMVEDDAFKNQNISFMSTLLCAEVEHINTGHGALALLNQHPFDVVLLDLLLPDVGGFEVLHRMRSTRIETPVLILSELSEPQAKVNGLRLGADDFVTRPFHEAELIARIRAVVRRGKPLNPPTLRLGPLTMNLDSRDVEIDHQTVHLTGREYAILELLVLRKGMVLSKEVLLKQLYGGMDEPTGKIIDVFICKLRKKLALAGADNLIGTVWGHGYVMGQSGITAVAPGSDTPRIHTRALAVI